MHHDSSVEKVRSISLERVDPLIACHFSIRMKFVMFWKLLVVLTISRSLSADENDAKLKSRQSEGALVEVKTDDDEHDGG